MGAPSSLDEASVTGTENAIMAAVLRPWRDRDRERGLRAAFQDLCGFLNALGARIEGIGSNVLRIQGVDRLRGEWRVCPDHIEVASFVGLGRGQAEAAVSKTSTRRP